MDLDTIIGRSPDSIMKGIAERVKRKRLERNLTQKSFATRSGVGYDAYRRFETTGEITLRNLVLCAVALGETDEFLQLFTRRSYKNIDELIESNKKHKRKRGSKNG